MESIFFAGRAWGAKVGRKRIYLEHLFVASDWMGLMGDKYSSYGTLRVKPESKLHWAKHTKQESQSGI